MKKLKIFRTLSALILCLLLLSAAACGRSEGPSSGDPPEETKETDAYAGEPLWDSELSEEDKQRANRGEPIPEILNVYSNVSDLVPVSSTIVTGTVTDNIRYTYENIVTTWYEFLVEECWKGGLQPGDVITIAQDGGYYTSEMHNAYWNSLEEGTGVLEEGLLLCQSALGVPLPEKGDRNLLFLTDWTDGSYCALSTFMARYYISDDGEVSRFVPDDLLASEMIRRSTDPSSLDELRKIVQACMDGSGPAAPVTMQENREMFLSWFETAGEMSPEEIRMYERCYDDVLTNVSAHASLMARSPTVLILGMDSPESAAGGDTFQDTMIREAGGINAAASYSNSGRFVRLSMSEILALDPDVLVLPSGYRYDAEDILKREEWQQLKAVREGRVAVVSGGAANCVYPTGILDGTGDPDVCIGVAWLHHVLNPLGYPEESYLDDLAVYAQANPASAEAVGDYRIGIGKE